MSNDEPGPSGPLAHRRESSPTEASRWRAFGVARATVAALVSSAWRAVVAVVRSWPPEVRDAALYGASACFALSTVFIAGIPLYRAWGLLALGPYSAGAAITGAAGWWALRRRRQGREVAPRRLRAARVVAFVIVLAGATIVPLALEVVWRTEGNASAHVQPEVVVVERAGVRVDAGKDPYQVVERNGRVVIPKSAGPAYELYYPYLPGMVLFGFSSGYTGGAGSKVEARLTDARIQFLVFTVAVGLLALSRLRAPGEPRLRAFQLLALLPTAALPLATGGDDMPVVACMLLGLVALQRRRPLLAGLALGVASSFKFTAWPLAFLALWVATDRHGRRAGVRYGAGVMAVLGAAVVPFAVQNPSAFVDNVIRFPLGLAGVSSPAASPLPGHLVVSAFPGARHLYVAVVLALGALAVVYRLATRPPRTASQAATLTGWVMLAAILVAPATRVGYLLYPANLFVWGWMLRTAEVPRVGRRAVAEGGGSERDEDQAASGASKRRMLKGVVPSGLVEDTVTPASQ